MEQRIAIIGGGIAGLAFAIYYKKLGGRVDIYERSNLFGHEGLGFIMLDNGVDGMTRLGLKAELEEVAYALDQCYILSEQGQALCNESLKGSFGIARKAFIDVLIAQIPDEWLHYGYQFSHFDWYDNGDAKEAVFKNGQHVQADLFLGCDGSRSRVRQEIFPEASRSDIKVKELVSIVKNSLLVALCRHHFIKYKALEGGLALGMVPVDEDHLVWFVQFNAEKYQIDDCTAAAKQQFAHDLVGHWNAPIESLIETTDFTNSHVWNTCYLYPLERVYNKNVILLGDAAHASLTFTSQGVNSAIEDAIKLAPILTESHQRHSLIAIEHYSVMRQKIIAGYLQQGLLLQDEFLRPHDVNQKIPFAF